MKIRGFTLIELLVVIAIIAVLMGILMPSLKAARDQAKRVQCVSNVKTLSLGWLMYAQEFDNHLVNGNVGSKVKGSSVPWVLSPGEQNVDLEEKIEAVKQGGLYPYIGKSHNVYRCPADRRIKHAERVAFCSFSIAAGANGEDHPSGEFKRAKKLSDIKRPSEKYVFVEDIDPRGYNVGSWCMGFSTARFIDPLAIWHNRRSTMGFADGHADMHRWNDNSFLEWANDAVEDSLTGKYGATHPELTPPDDEMEDYLFLAKGFPCKRILNSSFVP